MHTEPLFVELQRVSESSTPRCSPPALRLVSSHILDYVRRVTLIRCCITSCKACCSYRYGGSVQNMSVRLPITLNKFFQPTEMTSQEFFQRWKQLSV